MIMLKVCIFGTRSFSDYTVLSSTISALYPEKIEIISGHYKGADLLGERYGLEHKLSIKKDYKGDMENKNNLMAADCDEALGFWDLKSPGTRHMIKCLNLQRKSYAIYRFDGTLFEQQRFKPLHVPGCEKFVPIGKSGFGHCPIHSTHMYLAPESSPCLCDYCHLEGENRVLEREKFSFGPNRIIILNGLKPNQKLAPLAPMIEVHKAITAADSLKETHDESLDITEKVTQLQRELLSNVVANVIAHAKPVAKQESEITLLHTRNVIEHAKPVAKQESEIKPPKTAKTSKPSKPAAKKTQSLFDFK